MQSSVPSGVTFLTFITKTFRIGSRKSNGKNQKAIFWRIHTYVHSHAFKIPKVIFRRIHTFVPKIPMGSFVPYWSQIHIPLLDHLDFFQVDIHSSDEDIHKTIFLKKHHFSPIQKDVHKPMNGRLKEQLQLQRSSRNPKLHFMPLTWHPFGPYPFF